MRRALAVGWCLFFLISWAQAADPVSFSVGSFTFERPEGWGWGVPASAMRKAQLTAPAAAGSQPGEVTFFHFGPGQGGTTQANVDRWLRQFQDGQSDTRTEQVGRTQVTFVKASGTFASGMPGGPTTPLTGYALRGAILASPGGDVYVKMTGPAETVRAAESAFESMVRRAAE